MANYLIKIQKVNALYCSENSYCVGTDNPKIHYKVYNTVEITFSWHKRDGAWYYRDRDQFGDNFVYPFLTVDLHTFTEIVTVAVNH